MVELLVPKGERIRALRTDNAKEYCSDEFESFLRENEIHHELSTPYKQHQNGIAERYNRTIQEMYKTMLTHAKLPTTYWEEACKAAAYLRNRCITSALRHEMTPHEALTGSEQLRGKMSDRSREAIMVGYATTQKAYRLVDWGTKRKIANKWTNQTKSRRRTRLTMTIL